MIEIMKFRLSPGVDEAEFLLADKAMQQGFAYQQPGLLRRTTARGREGSWVVIALWRSVQDADACEARWEADPAVQRFMGLIDPDTFSAERYHELE